MKKRKAKIIKDPKARGEWVESVFMARAGERGLAVSKPWGESSSYDFVVGRPGRFVSVQVKSTVCESGGGYECCIRGRGNRAYSPGSFDFLAAYVVVEDTWYIIPAGKVRGKETVALFSKSKHAKYEQYREAWHLLREAAALGEEEGGVETGPEAGTEESATGTGTAARFPRNVAERMEAVADFVRQQMEGRGMDPRKTQR